MQARTMETEIDFANRDGKLISGMYTETQLVLAEKPDALSVPLEAVAENGNDATVLESCPVDSSLAVCAEPNYVNCSIRAI